MEARRAVQPIPVDGILDNARKALARGAQQLRKQPLPPQLRRALGVPDSEPDSHEPILEETRQLTEEQMRVRSAELLSETQVTLKTVITGSTLIPTALKTRLGRVVDTFRVLGEEEYLAIKSSGKERELIGGMVESIARSQGHEELKDYSGAFFAPSSDPKEVGSVTFRERLLHDIIQAYPDRPDVQQILFLYKCVEELGHAMYIPTPIRKLSEVKNMTLLLPQDVVPLEEVLAAFTAARKEKIPNAKPVKKDDPDLVYWTQGYIVSLADKVSGTALHSKLHALLEESRAAIVGTMLFAMCLGRDLIQPEMVESTTDLEVARFAGGLQAVSTLSLVDKEMQHRDLAALRFLISCMNSGGNSNEIDATRVRSTVSGLFDSFSKHLPALLSRLNSEQKSAFYGAVNSISGHYVASALSTATQGK